jgi:hypothetical protein
MSGGTAMLTAGAFFKTEEFFPWCYEREAGLPVDRIKKDGC